MNFNNLAERVHEVNLRWWQDPATGKAIERNIGELCMLITSELSEAMEGARKDLMDDHLPHRKMEEVEMADAIIRIFDLAGAHGIDLNEDMPEIGMKDNKGEALLYIVYNLAMFWRSQRNAYLVLAFQLIIAYCKKHNFDLWGAFEDKMAYNATRHDHTHEARLASGGKKW